MDARRFRDASPREIAEMIEAAVADRRLAPSTVRRVVEAVASREVSPTEVCRVLDYIGAHRKEIRSPAAYFAVSIKEVFRAAGVDWVRREPPSPRREYA